MALQKQPVPINFAQGLDTKTDPYQIPMGKFSSLVNSIFTTTARLTKRNGFALTTTLPTADQTTLTTLNDNLIATGTDLWSYSTPTNEWLNQGTIQPIELHTLSLLRDTSSQYGEDAAVAENGLVCFVYNNAGDFPYYQISDSTTGAQIVERTLIDINASDPRVVVLGRNFIITYILFTGGVYHLQYIAIPISHPQNPSTPVDIATDVNTDVTLQGYDCIVANNSLYVAWSATSTRIRLTFMSSTLIIHAAVTVDPAANATLMSVTADTSTATPTIWINYWDTNTGNGFASAYSSSLTVILAPTATISSEVLAALTSTAKNNVCSIYYEINNDYASPYPTPNVRSDYIKKNTITSAGVVGTASVLLRSVGLASKPFFNANGVVYMLVAYGEQNQPTYFIIDSLGNIYARLAYSNGGGYVVTQVLPSVTSIDGTFYCPYLIKDFLTTVNKTTNTSLPVNAIYTTTGINLLSFEINSSGQFSSEIADSLQLTGGQMWQYDGVKPVEFDFHVWPENIDHDLGGSGAVANGTYFYSFTYEWTDNTGKIHRSAPSIPLKVVVTGGPLGVRLYVPTLRLTYKTDPNPVRLVGYRWSTTQQTYYQFTEVNPVPGDLNDPTVDYVTIVDSESDAAILGNNILYTTGGVVENIAPPASIHQTLYKNRLVLIDAEDQNLLWFSKQVIEDVPVEMSDLFTIYVAPTIGSQGPTGPVTALSAMDDKLIIFKRNAIYYLTGTGPDNTGANNDFSDPIFITASVGCVNPNSIVLMQNGIMFQSDKGIYLLGRDLSTPYIGADVEEFNSNRVLSAQAIPGTTQVRFILDNNTMLMYDYFYNQWGTFTNQFAISATLYKNKHTYLNRYSQVLQETPGHYLDNSKPVLMSFTTSWFNLAGLQGFQRFYYFLMLGTYKTPFKLNTTIAFNFNPNPTQNILVMPDNAAEVYGNPTGTAYGAGGPYGGGDGDNSDIDASGNVFTARVFPEHQKCESFQLSVQEIYDPSLGIMAGQGLSLSGLELVVGVKKGFRTQRASRSFG